MGTSISTTSASAVNTLPSAYANVAVTPCDTATPASLERTRFFPRQLIGPDDLTQDQIYFREKLRRHNRMLHGWGVVCGVGVHTGQNSCQVIVEPGYVLGPWGDEIVIDQPTTFDVCKQSGQGSGCCGEELDPWCSDVRANCSAGTLYLAVRYRECQARPIRAGSCGCGCDDSTCEYSRTRDSFALGVLDALPAPYTTPMLPAAKASLAPCTNNITRPCPPCPVSPWVIIADLTVDATCAVSAIDCFAHRRYVITFANEYALCNTQVIQPPPGTTSAQPAGATSVPSAKDRPLAGAIQP